MSGKRVLDAIAILNATKNIAVKHFDIRLTQASVYTQTSSIFKAIRTQAPPPFAAAAQNFSNAVATGARSRVGIEQDHFYERSKENDARDAQPKEDLDIDQRASQRRPLPDGTIPSEDGEIGAEAGDVESFSTRPVGDGGQQPLQTGSDLGVDASNESTIPTPNIQKPLSSKDARIAQRRSEDQIPAVSADPPAEEMMADFKIEQEQDVFYQPPGTASPVLSALPRMRVPKTENDIQGGDSHIPKDINADVYYSGSNAAEAENAESEPTEEQLSQIFNSPRVANMLGKGKSKYAPGGIAGRKFHTSARTSQRNAEAEKKDIENLAAEMAKDAQQTPVSLSLLLAKSHN